MSKERLNIYRISVQCPQKCALACRGCSCDLLSADDVPELLFYLHKQTFKLQAVTLETHTYMSILLKITHSCCQDECILTSDDEDVGGY